MVFKTDLPRELKWRGLWHNSTTGVEALLASGPQAGYIGFDPTAASLHIGNLATIMLLVHLQRAGHRPIALVGGATGMIGDPSGKSEERKLLSKEELLHNQAGIQAQLERLLDFSPGQAGALLLNNYAWFENMGLLHFLRAVGKHLSINTMLTKDSVQKRLEHGISFTEFSYQLLQGYDYYYLYTHHNCRLQLGGSDQWGNIVAGTELIRRMGASSGGEEAHAITCPLLTKSDGSKFGKSEGGNLWLDAALTSPYKFYQFWLNSTDEDLPQLLKVFSLQDEQAIEALLAAHSVQPGLRQGQQALASELTARIHGQAALQTAQAATGVLFGETPLEALNSLTANELKEVFEGVPTGNIATSALVGGLTIVDLLVQSQALGSKSEAKRMLQAGSIRLNKQRVVDGDVRIEASQLLNQRYLLIQKGKKNYHLAVFTDD